MKRKIIVLLQILLFAGHVSLGQWSHKFYVDNFGDETKDDYISYFDNKGTFSNSATTNSLLIAKVIISYSDDTIPEIRLDLFEYGSAPSVGSVIGDADYTLNIKLSDGTVMKYPLRAGNNSLSFLKRLSNEFIDILKNESKSIKCYILIDGEYTIQTYNFIINPLGFSEAFNKLKRPIIQQPTLIIDEDRVFSFVQQMPEFPDGTKEMYNYIERNIKYPESAIKANISGRVIVRFIVNEYGKISDVEVIKGIGGGCDEEAIRVISEMPNWKPGMQKNRPVKVYYTLPVSFILD